ncbi:MAG: DUF6220 domain-containing protein [Chloroflexota bacterium]
MDIRRWARVAYLYAAWLFVACLVVQVFLAGLGVFAGAQNFATHTEFGRIFGLMTLILIPLAIIGRMGRRKIWLSVLVFVLFFLQGLFIALRDSAPAVAALHPVNGFLILWISILLAQSLWRERRSPAVEPSTEPAAAA